MTEVYCPTCKDYVEVSQSWEGFECPSCKRKGSWSEEHCGDDDYYFVPEWESE